MAAPIDRADGISRTPGDSCFATKFLKWTLMVLISPVTRTRPSSPRSARHPDQSCLPGWFSLLAGNLWMAPCGGVPFECQDRYPRQLEIGSSS